MGEVVESQPRRNGSGYTGAILVWVGFRPSLPPPETTRTMYRGSGPCRKNPPDVSLDSSEVIRRMLEPLGTF